MMDESNSDTIRPSRPVSVVLVEECHGPTNVGIWDLSHESIDCFQSSQALLAPCSQNILQYNLRLKLKYLLKFEYKPEYDS